MSEHRWYMIQTYAGSEIAVKRAIGNLVKDNKIEGRLKGTVVPTGDAIEFKDGKEKISERSLYSGYVFADLNLDTGLWHRIRSLPKVGCFIGEPKNPTPLSKKDINLILEKVYNKATPKPKISFEEGENVRITEGPFTNFTSIVGEYDIVCGLLELNVSIFGRSTPVEILYPQVEKVV